MCCWQKGGVHDGLMVSFVYEAIASEVCDQTHHTTDSYIGSYIRIYTFPALQGVPFGLNIPVRTPTEWMNLGSNSFGTFSRSWSCTLMVSNCLVHALMYVTQWGICV